MWHATHLYSLVSPTVQTVTVERYHSPMCLLFVFLCVYGDIFNPGGRGVGEGGKDREGGGGYKFVHADLG